jgi:hypothetical protein
MSLTINQKEIVAKLKEEFIKLNKELIVSNNDIFDFGFIDELKIKETKVVNDVNLSNSYLSKTILTEWDNNVKRIKPIFEARGFVVTEKNCSDTKNNFETRRLHFDFNKENVFVISIDADFLTIKQTVVYVYQLKGHSYKVVGNGRYRDAVNSDTFDGLFKTNFVIERIKRCLLK